jgi:hypothetical protein
MTDINKLADVAIKRAKHLQEFAVFRDMDSIVFSGKPAPYSIRHNMGELAEIMVPAIDQAEAEERVDAWIDGQRV